MSIHNAVESSEYYSCIIDNEGEPKLLLNGMLSLGRKSDKQKVGICDLSKPTRECCFQLNTSALIFQ